MPPPAKDKCAKGPQVMFGYWNNIEATNQCMTTDDYFKTGDIVMLDEKGFFHIVDRKKDMINASNFNVYPSEIDAQVAKMPGILESTCVGIADDKTVAAVKFFFVIGKESTDTSINAQNVIDFCQQGLTAYKVPKEVIFINTSPN